MDSRREETEQNGPGEATPLLPREEAKEQKRGKSVVYRLLLCAFMVSLSFGVTQVPYVTLPPDA